MNLFPELKITVAMLLCVFSFLFLFLFSFPNQCHRFLASFAIGAHTFYFFIDVTRNILPYLTLSLLESLAIFCVNYGLSKLWFYDFYSISYVIQNLITGQEYF